MSEPRPDQMCDSCGTELSEEEIDHCNDLCFDCYSESDNEVHPDSIMTMGEIRRMDN